MMVIMKKNKHDYEYLHKKILSSNLLNANKTEVLVYGLQGACYLDKGYCVNPAPRIAKAKGVHLAAIKKNNMKGKNRDKDRWYSEVRSPYERVFSQRERRVRYRGTAKNQFAAFMQAICSNLKRIIVLNPPNICFS